MCLARRRVRRRRATPIERDAELFDNSVEAFVDARRPRGESERMTDPAAHALREDEVQDLLRVAHAAALLAHSPYSNVQVGAALLSTEGDVFAGCNVENASFGLTICAERVAVVKAVSAGAHRFRALAIATAGADPLMPCGACRQFLAEFGTDLRVVVQGKQGPRVEATLAELLPKPFLPSDLR